MTKGDGFYQFILSFVYVAAAYAVCMSNDRERVISITLSEAEWQAFIARQPQPVLWLREQIRAEAGTQPASEQTEQTQTAA